jgi:hypothetical protein
MSYEVKDTRVMTETNNLQPELIHPSSFITHQSAFTLLSLLYSEYLSSNGSSLCLRASSEASGKKDSSVFPIAPANTPTERRGYNFICAPCSHLALSRFRTPNPTRKHTWHPCAKKSHNPAGLGKSAHCRHFRQTIPKILNQIPINVLSYIKKRVIGAFLLE